MPSLRELLVAASSRCNYNRPIFQEQIASIDIPTLQGHIERMEKRAAILSHAFDVMIAGVHEHPMPALLHSVECHAPVSDSEFAILLSVWGQLCNGNKPAIIAQG